MAIDLRTFALFLSITHILQVVVLFIQYRVNKIYSGPGWWVLGGVAGALGFGIVLLREAPDNLPVLAVVDNLLFISGFVFPYIGVLRFFGRKERKRPLIAFYLAVTLLLVYFAAFDDNATARRVINSGGIVLFSFLLAWRLLTARSRSVALPANFLAGVFLTNGLYYGVRILASFNILTLSTQSVLLVTLVGSTLWTFGFIMLVNQRLNAERYESEKRYRLLSDHSNDVIWTATPAGQFTYVSPSVFQMRGFTPEEVIRAPFDQAFCPGSLQTARELLNTALAKSQEGQRGPADYFEIEQPRKDGATVWTEATARVICDEAGVPLELVISSRDITERKQYKENLQKQAIADELTGISNRRYFMQIAPGELYSAIHRHCPLTVALIDIDCFKQINDTYGHAAGDQALVTFVRAVQKIIREVDVFARFGGDEFILLFPETDQDRACAALERIRQAIQSLPFNFNGSPVTITISSGVVGLCDEQVDFDVLIARADQALYLAKEAGRNRVMVAS